MGQRIKGQTVTLNIMVDGDLVNRIDTITSADVEFLLDMSDEGYLGETTQRYDSTFMGISFELSGHLTSAEIFSLTKKITDRAQQRSGAATRFDIGGTFLFPTGAVATILIPDVSFEGVPITVGGRADFVEFKLSGKGSTFEIIES